ncbi:MAG: hypothetical protein HY401_01800 [Elusimicrobia bacterium]|nr:hypothetical protein [Elusimicrobiota bacterium]
MKKILAVSLFIFNLAAVAMADDQKADNAKKEPFWAFGLTGGVGDIDGNEVKPFGVQLQLGAGLGSNNKWGTVGVNASFIESRFDNTKPFKTGGWSRVNASNTGEVKNWNRWERTATTWILPSVIRVEKESASLNQIDTTIKELGGIFYRTPRLGGRIALEAGTRLARYNHDPGYAADKVTTYYQKPCTSLSPSCGYYYDAGGYAYKFSETSEQKKVDAGGPKKGFGQAVYAGINVLLARPGKTYIGESYPGVNLTVELTKTFLGDNRLKDSNTGVRFNIAITGN